MSNQQIERQDFVDGLIHQLLNDLNPKNSPIDWNIELIGLIRDQISDVLVERLELCTEEEFYP